MCEYVTASKRLLDQKPVYIAKWGFESAIVEFDSYKHLNETQGYSIPLDRLKLTVGKCLKDNKLVEI